MCKASQTAKEVVEMEAGQVYGIGTSGHGLAAFHPHGTKATDCIACAQTGDQLTLTRVPLEIQEKYGIGPRVPVTFIQTGHNIQDMVELPNGTQISLRELTDKGIGVYSGHLVDITTEDEVYYSMPTVIEDAAV